RADRLAPHDLLAAEPHVEVTESDDQQRLAQREVGLLVALDVGGIAVGGLEDGVVPAPDGGPHGHRLGERVLAVEPAERLELADVARIVQTVGELFGQPAPPPERLRPRGPLRLVAAGPPSTPST